MEDFAVAMERIETAEALWKACLIYFRHHGIDRVSYHHVPPRGASDAGATRITATGFPEEWMRTYITERLYRVDPVAVFSQHSIEPFFWSDIAKLKPLSPVEKAFLKRLDYAQLGDGLCVQVFGPFGRNGFCGLGLGHGRDRIGCREIRALQWACQLGHLKYCTILSDELDLGPVLTSREIEVLDWMARGKSNAVIAEILGLSPHTIDAHLRRVYLKLGVTGRTSAALRALGVGLIQADG